MAQVIRQGDVLVERIPGIPAIAKPQKRGKVRGRNVLAYGEVTGHHHSVAVKDSELLEAAEQVYLRIMNTTTLDHQEHGSITLEPGAYRVRIQREYVPGALPQSVRD